MLRIAIIGVGWAGTRHVEAIRELGDKLQVTCLVDNDPVHLREQAQALGVAKTYTEFTAALADPEIDAVSLCTPHSLHCPQALLAAAAGKHILVEKPMATSVEDATRMVDSARRHGVKLYVAENVPYSPMSKFLRGIVQSGELTGEIVAAAYAGGFRAEQYGYPGRRAWLAEPDRGGSGTWLLHGIHSMAQLRYIFGEVATVYLQQHRTSSFTRTDVEATMSGLFTLANGVNVAILQTAESKPYGNLAGYVIHGARGSVRASAAGYEHFTAATPSSSGILPYPAEQLSDYAQEMAAFADYVAGVAVGPTTGVSERRSLAIVQAGYESARHGQPVNLTARFGAL